MAKGITIPVTMEKHQTGEQQLTVLAFSRSGKLLGNRDVAGGKAQFDNLDLPASELRVFILPKEIPGLEKVRNLDDLLKFQPYEPQIDFQKDKLQIKPIPDHFFDLWKLRFCRVPGRVQKWFNLYGTPGNKGICRARVHICEVDHIRWWLPRIPDEVILRIPEIILKPELPIRIPPPPRPIKEIIDPGRLKNIILPKAPETAGMAGNPFQTFGTTDISVPRLKSLPVINENIRKQLLTQDIATIRRSIQENFKLFHPYFCYHPWFWPYLYRYDELAVVYTDLNGRFDATITYLEGGDVPDLYFWVEVMVNGVWTTVYKPSVPCNTWWDYTCGSEVTLQVTDERVQWGCQEIVPGEVVWIKTIGHGASVSRIRQTNGTQLSNNTPAVASNRIGMADFTNPGDYKNPFGSTIYFIVQFSSGLPNNNLYYYKWKYCRTHNADLLPINANPTDADFTELTNPVSKSYTYEYIDPVTNIKHFGAKSVALGPVSAGGTDRLYHIPPTNPAMAPFNVPESSPFWDQNTYAMGLDTFSLDGDGLYMFRLELYNKSGVRMTALPKVLFQVPHAASFTPSIVAPDVMQTDVAGMQSNGFQLQVRINNQRCEAAVYKVKLNGVDASPDCCGFVKYGHPAAPIELGYKAMHPHNHAEYDFTIQKGTCNDAGMSGLTNVSDSEVIGHANGYTRDANGIYRKNFTPLQLLGICSAGGKAAFAEQVYVRAHAINGNTRLSGYDASGTAAFALEP